MRGRTAPARAQIYRRGRPTLVRKIAGALSTGGASPGATRWVEDRQLADLTCRFWSGGAFQSRDPWDAMDSAAVLSPLRARRTPAYRRSVGPTRILYNPKKRCEGDGRSTSWGRAHGNKWWLRGADVRLDKGFFSNARRIEELGDRLARRLEIDRPGRAEDFGSSSREAETGRAGGGRTRSRGVGDNTVEAD